MLKFLDLFKCGQSPVTAIELHRYAYIQFKISIYPQNCSHHEQNEKADKPGPF